MASSDSSTDHPVPVPELRYFGTTWLRRGPAYWARRVLLTVVLVVLTAGGGFLVNFIREGLALGGDGAGGGDALVYPLAVLAVGVCSAIAVFRTWRRLEASRNSRAEGSVVRRSAASRAEGAGDGGDAGTSTGRSGEASQTPVLVIGVVGWLAAHLVHSFVEAPYEAQTRRLYQHRVARAKEKARGGRSKAGGKAKAGGKTQGKKRR